MRKAHQILAYVLAGMVVVQAMAISYAIAGVFHWIDKTNGAVLNHDVLKSWDKHSPTFHGSGGFALHGIDGFMIIPLLTLVLLIVSLFAMKEVPGAGKRAGILLGMVVLQFILGVGAHGAIVLAPLHALNGFGIFVMAYLTGKKAGEAAPASA